MAASKTWTKCALGEVKSKFPINADAFKVITFSMNVFQENQQILSQVIHECQYLIRELCIALQSLA